MSSYDDVKRRIEKRKKPLNDGNFKKLYNSMIRLMVMMVVILSSLIILKNPEMEENIFNGAYVSKIVTYISKSVLSFLPEDLSVSQNNNYTLLKDDYYRGNSNQIISFKIARVIEVNNKKVIIIDENGVEITYLNIKDINVKKGDTLSKDEVIASYEDKFKMIIKYLGKKISYQEYLEM